MKKKKKKNSLSPTFISILIKLYRKYTENTFLFQSFELFLSISYSFNRINFRNNFFVFANFWHFKIFALCLCASCEWMTLGCIFALLFYFVFSFGWCCEFATKNYDLLLNMKSSTLFLFQCMLLMPLYLCLRSTHKSRWNRKIAIVRQFTDGENCLLLIVAW